MKITNATITAMPRPMPKGMSDRMSEVVATFEDGSQKTLFAFFPDEISFQASVFIDLTEEEAHTLYQQRDTAYLRMGNSRHPGAPQCAGLREGFAICYLVSLRAWKGAREQPLPTESLGTAAGKTAFTSIK